MTVWKNVAAAAGSPATLVRESVAALGAHPWPGNVRELQNVLANLTVTGPSYGPVGPDARPAAFRKTVAAERRPTLAEAHENLERTMVRDALGRDGSTARARRRAERHPPGPLEADGSPRHRPLSTRAAAGRPTGLPGSPRRPGQRPPGSQKPRRRHPSWKEIHRERPPRRRRVISTPPPLPLQRRKALPVTARIAGAATRCRSNARFGLHSSGRLAGGRCDRSGWFGCDRRPLSRSHTGAAPATSARGWTRYRPRPGATESADSASKYIEELSECKRASVRSEVVSMGGIRGGFDVRFTRDNWIYRE